MKVARPERAAGNCGKFEAAMIDLSNKLDEELDILITIWDLWTWQSQKGAVGMATWEMTILGTLKIGKRTKG